MLITGACTEVCFCDVITSTVDCSNQQLDEFPNFDSISFQVSDLIISQNSIYTISSTDLKSETLEEVVNLQLNSNFISKIEVDAFSYLKSLKVLNMTFNSLEMFPTSSLVELSSTLEILDISYNAVVQANFDVRMLKLKHLNMEFNGLNEIKNNSFSGLESLETLNLNYSPLRSLEEDGSSLNGLSALKKLSFEYNQFYATPSSSAFSKVRENLEYLSFSKNFRLEIISPMSFPVLKTLKLSSCKLGVIGNDTFVGAPSVEFLDLSYSQIPLLATFSLRGLETLKSLNISGNGLSLVPYRSLQQVSETLEELVADDLPLRVVHSLRENFDINFMGNLLHLSLVSCPIENISDSSFFNNLKKLKTLKLSNTRLSKVPSQLGNLASLELLEFNWNPIKM